MAKQVGSVFLCLIIALWLLVGPAAAQDRVINASNAFQLQEILRLGRGKVYGARFSPDGSQVLVGSSLGIWLYDTNALNRPIEPKLLPTSRAAVYLDQSPDGNTIYAGYSDIVQVWINGEVTYAIDTGRRLSAMALSRDGNLLATAHTNNTIQFRHNLSTTPIIPLGYSIGVKGFAFSPDGSVLATGSDDGSLGLWHIADSVTLTLLKNEVDVRVFKFMPDGSPMASGEEDDDMRARNSMDGIAVIVVETGAGITALAFTEDGSALVTGNEVGVVSLWDAETAELLHAFDEAAHRRSVTAIAMSPDGVHVASGGREGDIQLWDIRERTKARGDNVEAWIQPGRGIIRTLQFSPDGSLLLVSAEDEFVGLYDVATRSLLMSAVGHTDDMISFEFNQTGDALSLADDDGNLWLWHGAPGAEITRLPTVETIASSRESRRNLQYAPDGSFIAVNGRSDTYLLDPQSGATLRVLDVDGSPSSLSVSPDGSMVAVSSNWNLSVFSVDSGFLVAKISAHNDRVLSAQFSPDQRLLASAGADGTLRVYGLDAAP